jgi:hypothetical protein
MWAVVFSLALGCSGRDGAIDAGAEHRDAGRMVDGAPAPDRPDAGPVPPRFVGPCTENLDMGADGTIESIVHREYEGERLHRLRFDSMADGTIDGEAETFYEGDRPVRSELRDAAGRVLSTGTIEYDAEGRVTRRRTERDGVIDAIVTFEYLDGGALVIERHDRGGDGVIEARIEERYEGEDLVSREAYDAAGVLNQRDAYRYSVGRLVEQRTRYTADGTGEGDDEIVWYDYAGELLWKKEIWILPAAVRRAVETWQYDEGGNATSHLVVDQLRSGGPTPEVRTTWTYECWE